MKNKLKFLALSVIFSLILLKCCSLKSRLPVKVDHYAVKYTSQFVEGLIENDINTKTLKDSIDSIVFYPLQYKIYGLYVPKNRQIVINSFYYQDTIIIRKVIYHELGHLYGLSHDTHGIMSTRLSELTIHKLYNPMYGGSRKQWDIHKAYFFSEIRKYLLNLDKSK